MIHKPQFRLGLAAFVFATALTVGLAVAAVRGLAWSEKWDLSIALAVVVAVATLLAFMAGGYALALRFARQKWRHFLARRMLAALYECREQKLACTGIAEKEGSLIVIIAAGLPSGLVRGAELTVDNPAGVPLGRLEVLDVEGGSALCGVLDRVEPTFWDKLETRMKADFSPPPGVVITRRLAPTIVNEVKWLLEVWSERA